MELLPSVFSFSVAGAVAAGAVIVLGHFYGVWGKELVHGKTYIFEQTAGILRITAAAFHLRDAVIIGRDEKLGISLQPNQRKLP